MMKKSETIYFWGVVHTHTDTHRFTQRDAKRRTQLQKRQRRHRQAREGSQTDKTRTNTSSAAFQNAAAANCGCMSALI